MQNQPMQLDRKQFQELLKEIKMYNKLDLVAQAFQTKYAKEAAGEDDDQRRKDAAKTNELLEKILESFSGNYRKGIATPARRKALSEAGKDDDNDKPRTLKEDLQMFKGELKTGVAFGKRIGGGIKDAVLNPVQTLKKVASGVGQATKFGYEQGKDILSTPTNYQRNNVAAVSQPSAKQVIEASGKADNPNVVSEPDEIIAQETEKQSATFKELLDVTKQSLDQLKAIRGAVEGAPATRSAQPTSKTKKDAPVAAAPAAAEEGGGLVGDVVGAAAGGIGGKIMGGLKAGGAMLGKGALAAGKMIGGAALAKPALIAAGVGLAAYGAYKGYKALTGGGEKEGEKPTKQPIVSKESGTISLATFAQNDPKGFEEYQKFVQDEMEKGEKQIDDDFKSGKKKGARKVFMENLERDVKKKALAKFKDKMKAAGALKEGEASVKGQAEPTSAVGAAAMAPAAGAAATSVTSAPSSNSDATGMGDDGEYKRVDTGSLRQGQQGLKAQHEQFVRDTKPGSGYKEEAPKKTIGERIAGFFGFGKKEEQPATKEISSAEAKMLSRREEQGRLKPGDKEKLSTFRGEPGDVPVDTGSLRQGQQGLKAQHEQFMRDTKPGSGYKEEPVAPKKSIGQRIASFFGFGKKEEQPAGEISSAEAKMLSRREEQGRLKPGDKEKLAEFRGEPTVAAAKPIDKSKMHPMARRQLEALEAQNKKNQDAHMAELAAAKKQPESVAQTSAENAAMKDEMSTGGKTTTPVVMNNVSTNNQTTFVPIKGEPRPTHRGSALDRYNDRIANF